MKEIVKLKSFFNLKINNCVTLWQISHRKLNNNAVICKICRIMRKLGSKCYKYFMLDFMLKKYFLKISMKNCFYVSNIDVFSLILDTDILAYVY